MSKKVSKEKIDLSLLKENPETEKAMIRAKLNKNPKLMKILIFLKYKSPVSLSNLAGEMSQKISMVFNRAMLRYNVDVVLGKMGLVDRDSFSNGGRTTENKLIIKEHLKNISSIPEHAQKNLDYTVYYSLSDYGNEFIDFCMERLGMKK